MAKLIKWFKDISSEDNEIGGYEINLAGMANARFPVPPGFIVTAEAYKTFIEQARIEDAIQNLLKNTQDKKHLQKTAQEIQQLIIKAAIHKEIQERIIDSYELLGVKHKTQAETIMQGTEEVVTIRPSANIELPERHSSKLFHVHGRQNVIKAIHASWASLFTPENIRLNSNKEMTPIVVVQRMIDSEKSGVMSTMNPATNNKEEIIILAAHGLGEAVTSGAVTPDTYIVDKKTLNIKEAKVNEQEFKISRDPKTGRNVKEKLSSADKRLQVLTDKEVYQIARYGRKIHEHHNAPQNIEWAIKDDQVHIMQCRAAKYDALKEAAKKEEEPAAMPEEEKKKAATEVKSKESKIPKKLEKPEVSPTKEEKSETRKEAIKPKTAATSPKESTVSTKVKVIIDLPKHAENIAQQTNADGGLVRTELIIARTNTHPAHYIKENRDEDYTALLANEVRKVADAFKNKPVWLCNSDIRSDEHRNLKGGNKEPYEADPLIGWHGIRRLLDEANILKAEFKVVKHLHEQGYNNINILLPFVRNSEEVKKAKNLLNETGLKQAKFGVMIETPASCLAIEDICREGIAYALINIDNLAQLTLGIDQHNKNTQKHFNQMDSTVLNLVTVVIQACKKHGVETSMCGNVSPKMAEFLVKHGVDSITTEPHKLQSIKQAITQSS